MRKAVGTMDKKNFWEAAGWRALRTVCQTAIASIGTAAVLSDVNWGVVISASILAGILSILTSVATGLPEVGGDHD
jgi:ABC-type protease/lipase transport system fused ATPase/permease subunit